MAETQITPPPQSLSLDAALRAPRLLGLATAILFFGLFGIWAWLAPLSSAAVAPGVVSPDGSRRTVQHLEGGIVRQIFVREGDHVTQGDTLVTLDATRAQARFEEIRERMIFLHAQQARLVAEAKGAATIDFAIPADLAADRPDQIEAARASQQALFESRRETQTAREQILAKRVGQMQEQIAGLRAVITAQTRQLTLLETEIATSTKLAEQGLERLAPLLALQREAAGVEASRASNQAQIAQLDQQIGETELQLVATRQQMREEVSSGIADIRAELSGLRSQLPERLDALQRTIITAPLSGAVLNIKVTTENGGILRPGEPILDIVPDDDPLVIDARVGPKDIDTVFPGLQARVILSAFAQRNLPQVYGVVKSISADRLIDERTGEPYFLAKVYVGNEALSGLDAEIALSPGMPVDVMILTGERTLLDYLVSPFADSLRASFREK